MDRDKGPRESNGLKNVFKKSRDNGYLGLNSIWTRTVFCYFFDPKERVCREEKIYKRRRTKTQIS